MIGSQPANPTGFLLRAIARREIALASNDADLLNAAMADHDRAAELTAPRDRRRVELCDQRRQTLMRMGRYEEAMADVRSLPQDAARRGDPSLQSLLPPDGSGPVRRGPGAVRRNGRPSRVNSSTARDRWRPGTSSTACRPASRGIRPKAGRRARRSTPCTGRQSEYRQLAAAANAARAGGLPSHVVARRRGAGVQPGRARRQRDRDPQPRERARPVCWPCRAKTPPGPPTAGHIAYVRDRQVLPITDLTTEQQGEHRPFEQEEIWIVRVDGTEAPRFLATGGWPNWNRDSDRVYYHSRADKQTVLRLHSTPTPQPREIRESMDYFPVGVARREVRRDHEHEGSTLQILDLATGRSSPGWAGPAERQQLFINWSARRSNPEHRMLLRAADCGSTIWRKKRRPRSSTAPSRGAVGRAATAAAWPSRRSTPSGTMKSGSPTRPPAPRRRHPSIAQQKACSSQWWS